MRAVLSRIVVVLSRLAAPLIVIGVGAYFLTGTIVQGGQGPGKGERPVLAALEHKDTAATPATAQGGEGTAVDPTLTIAQREAKTQGDNAPLRSVEVKTYVAQAMPINVPLRGITKAKATVTAVAETSGTVASVAVTKGQTVKAGDLLCTLDPETRQAAVAQAEAGLAQANASLTQAQADYDTNAELRAKGLATPNSARALEVSLSGAKASVSSAQVGLDNAKRELARTKISAKSPGIVSDPLATVGSTLAAGSPCATIVQLDPIVFVGEVPEARISYAKTGLSASVTTVTGQTLTGTVSYVAPVAEAATRTFEADIDLPNPGNVVRAGLTATATINVGTAPAQLLPQSVLTLDDSGTMGVRAVDNGKVVFYPVTIVQDAREGMYVTGLPLKVDVITVGQEFVKAGEKVNAVQDLGKSSVGPTAATAGAQS